MSEISKATLTIHNGIVSDITTEACDFFTKLPENIIGQPFVLALEHALLLAQSKAMRIIAVNTLSDNTHQIQLNQTSYQYPLSNMYQFIDPLVDNVADPLTKIEHSTEALLDDDNLTKEEQDAYLHSILSTVKSLSLLFDDIKSHGKSMCSDEKNQWEHINLRTFCRRIVDEQMTNYSHVTCQVEFQGTIQNVIVQPQMFRNIIANLLSNAAKYSPSNSIIYMMVNATEDGLTIMIEDHGLGMTNTDMQNLYTPFYKGKIAKDSTDAGLGLAIVKHSVDVHHGDIHFDSVVGQGTTVTVTIPNYNSIEDSINEKVV